MKLNLTKSKSGAGFTIIEVVIVVAIFAILSIVLISVFIGQNRIYRTQTAELNVTGDARSALDDIDNYARGAYRVVNTYSTYTTGSSVAILQIQSVNGSNQLINGTYDYVVYYLTGSNFFRQVFPDLSSARAAVTKKLASNVTGLGFFYNNPNLAAVTEIVTNITVQENAGVQNRAITLSSKSRLRNY